MSQSQGDIQQEPKLEEEWRAFGKRLERKEIARKFFYYFILSGIVFVLTGMVIVYFSIISFSVDSRIPWTGWGCIFVGMLIFTSLFQFRAKK